MQRVFLAVLTAGMLSVGWQGRQNEANAAAPAPTSYAGVEKTIASIRAGWALPNAPQDPNAPGWNMLFDALLADLREYSHAETPAARLVPLNRIHQISTALATVPWAPASQLREDLRQWLRPRVHLAWAERRLDDTVRGLPPTSDPPTVANRQRWVDFVDNDLGKALGQYNGATSVAQRQEGLNKVHASLKSLQGRNHERPWQPSWDLQNAVNDLFNQPNLDLTADVNVVGPFLDQNLVTSGPVYRKGYWSQVTAGPKTGFGLLPSDDGIAFYNSQLFTSVTPITDFHNQIGNDPQGRRAAKMYAFSATTYDWAELTIYTVLRTTGLQIWPAYNHNINAAICSVPTQGGGIGRLVAGLVGFNQNAINQKVYEGAIGQFRQRIPVEAMEEAQERIGGEQAQRNTQLREFLPGDGTAAIRDFLVSGLALRSRPQAVYVSGLLQSRTGNRQRGADAPQPASLTIPDSGVTADVHLTSVLNSLADGLYQRPEVQAVENLMIQTSDVPPGTPPREAATIRTNVDFPTYSKLVDEVRKANNARITALRIKRPPHAPEFAADAKGRLVALIHDVEIDVPAPDKSSQAGSVLGVPARILRIKLPHVEIALSHALDPTTRKINAKVEDFTPAANSQVLAINDDESRPAPLTRFSGALVISAISARLRSQPITLDPNNANLRGLAIQSLSPLDPSGWMRVNLVQNGQPMTPPAVAPAQPAPAPPMAAAVPAETR